MAEEDFGIDYLASYLHLTPSQVSRLVERGKVPGRRVSGQWRFSPAEIHSWLEERIGLSNEEELAQMEDVLRGSAGSRSRRKSITVSDLLPLTAIAVPLKARTRGSVITSMCELAAQTGMLWDAGKMADAVRAREEMAPTALENGVALLHPRRPMANILAEPFLAFGRTETGLPFGGARGTLTDLFFLICSVDDQGHLQVLARLSRLLTDEDLLTELRATRDPASALAAIGHREAELAEQ